ncbi:MAG: GNAT family N-acetyltransferase [Acidimicrobiales bacterium]
MGRPADVQVIRWCGEEARTGPWRGDRAIAYLSPLAGGPVPSPAFVHRCLDRLAADGFRRVITSALGPLEQAAFLGAGFQVEERLWVLVHDLHELPPAPAGDRATSLRRARSADRAAALEVDGLAFQPFWHLDGHGLDEALSATPHVRFRVAGDQRSEIVGYAITGRAGARGFVQRLAVHPDHQGRGLGRTLLLDGLRWLRRRRVTQVVVNTQVGTARALALYQAAVFRTDSSRLCVLSAGLPR